MGAQEPVDRRSSPIIDTDETPSANGSPRYWRNVLLSVLLVLAGVFFYNSIYVVMRLRPDPPPFVIGAKLSSDKAAYRSQVGMARGCWDYAIGSVQKDYPFGRSLPKNPPPRFKNGTRNPSEVSVLCWPRLRVAWTRRESWVRSYRWNTQWITNSQRSFRRTLHRILEFLDVTD